MHYLSFLFILLISGLPVLMFFIHPLNILKVIATKEVIKDEEGKEERIEIPSGLRNTAFALYLFMGSYLWLLWGMYCAGLGMFYAGFTKYASLYYVPSYLYGSYISKVARRVTFNTAFDENTELTISEALPEYAFFRLLMFFIFICTIFFYPHMPIFLSWLNDLLFV